MLTIEEIRVALVDRRPSVVAEMTGLHANTIANIRDGRKAPSYETLRKLSDYLARA